MALESGRVNSYKEALVLVRFSEGAAIECVIDTGFDGGLVLPRALVSQIQIATIGEFDCAKSKDEKASWRFCCLRSQSISNAASWLA